MGLEQPEIKGHTEVSSFSLACHVPVACDQVGSHASSILRTKRRFEQCQVSETRLAVGSTSASMKLYSTSLAISSRFWGTSNTTPSCCKAADSDSRQCINAGECFDEVSMDPSDEWPDAAPYNRQYSLITQATVCFRQWRMIFSWRSRVLARKSISGQRDYRGELQLNIPPTTNRSQPILSMKDDLVDNSSTKCATNTSGTRAVSSTLPSRRAGEWLIIVPITKAYLHRRGYQLPTEVHRRHLWTKKLPQADIHPAL